jgi:hypothetical protein
MAAVTVAMAMADSAAGVTAGKCMATSPLVAGRRPFQRHRGRVLDELRLFTSSINLCEYSLSEFKLLGIFHSAAFLAGIAFVSVDSCCGFSAFCCESRSNVGSDLSQSPR